MSHDKVFHCAYCRTKMRHGPGIGHFCDNDKCENVDGPTLEESGYLGSDRPDGVGPDSQVRAAMVIDRTPSGEAVKPTPPDPPLDALEKLIDNLLAANEWDGNRQTPESEKAYNEARAALLSAYRPQALTPGAGSLSGDFARLHGMIDGSRSMDSKVMIERQKDREALRRIQAFCTAQPSAEAHEADTREARPMKLWAHIDRRDPNHITFSWDKCGPGQISDHSFADPIVKEIAYRINAFEAPGHEKGGAA